MSDETSSTHQEAGVGGALHRLSQSLWLPVLLALCFSLPKLNQGDFNVDTGRYAAIALHAWRGAVAGDPGALLTLEGPEGVGYYNKPPLTFWLHGPPLILAGDKLWAARLPSVLAVAATAGGLAWIVLRACAPPPGAGRTDPREIAAARRMGVLAGCVLATTYTFTSLGHAISPDLWQAAFLLMAIAPAAEALRRQQGSWLALSGVGVGLALLVKPFVALLVPLILLVWLAWERRWRWLGWVGAAVFLALLIAAPWHAAMIALHGDDFTNQYFGREILNRAAGTLPGINRGAASPLYYLTVLFESYWPWLLALPVALVWVVRDLRVGRESGRSHHRPWLRLMLVWIALFAIALTLHPDKRPRYLAVLYPPVAVLIGIWLGSLRTARWRDLVDGGLRLAAPVALAVALLVAVLPIRVHGPTPRHWRAFLAWHDEAGRPQLWEGGFGLAESSRLYLAEGQWPFPTHDGLDRPIAQPPQGALIAYHHRHPLQPGEGEEIVFQSEDGHVTVMRLLAAEWKPRRQGEEQPE